MKEFIAGEFDIVVVGAGHAGVEAALASARLGCKTIIFGINLDSIANMPCNPNIGGTAKGHLVREIDALGGEMGKAADKTFIQSRTLNASKGPAVFSLRAQIDRRRYQTEMKKTLEQQDGLVIRQSEVVKLMVEDKKITGVVTNTGAIYKCKATILTTGTYLDSRIIMGETVFSGGPDGMFSAIGLSDSLRELEISLFRFKTGTPARISKKSVDISKMEEQPGDLKVTPYSFENEDDFEQWNKDCPTHLKTLVTKHTQVPCWLTYTNENTHNIIKKNIHRSPLYSGVIEGVGPRYCPSVEDKVVRFADKDRHQVFVEPMGLDTEEMYLQGMSTSMPEDVQIEMIQSLNGLEQAVVMRSAYAIEYDCIDATQLNLSLEFKNVGGLFSAGQINGTSGYEEAAAQGLIAGINAFRKIKGIDPLVLDRSQAYIGVLIDDIVTKGTQEPYRMLTSRSEYRLLLRQDNADRRLTEIGYNTGLISEERYEKFINKQDIIIKEIERLNKTFVAPSEKLNDLLEKVGSTKINTGISFSDLLRRPQVTYDLLGQLEPERAELPSYLKQQIETEVKFEGYIKRQLIQVNQFKKLEKKLLPSSIDYSKIYGLRIEARQKLTAVKPESVGQASRISGVSPADIAVLLVYLETIRKG